MKMAEVFIVRVEEVVVCKWMLMMFLKVYKQVARVDLMLYSALKLRLSERRVVE